MSINPAVGIEGNSFSGKSTLAASLQKEYGFGIVEEPSYFVEAFPPTPVDTQDVIKNLHFFLEVEKRRAESTKEICATGRIPAQDRSLWTYIHFEYANQAPWVQRPSAYQESLDIFQKAIDQGDIVAPPILIALTPGSQEVMKERELARGTVDISFLNNWQYTKLVDHFLFKLVGIYGQEQGEQLITTEGIKSLAASVKRLVDNAPCPLSVNLNLTFDLLRELSLPEAACA